MQDIQNRAVIIDSFLPTPQVFLGGGAVDEDLRFDALAAQPNLLERDSI